MKMNAHTTRKHRRHSGALQCLSLLLASSMACAATVPITQPQARSTEIYTSPDHTFTIVLPKDWTEDEQGHSYGDLATIAGARLTGPLGSDRVPVTISVLHYNGEGLSKTPEAFIHNKLNFMGRIDTDRKAVLTDIKVAKRPGKAFQIKTYRLVYLPNPVLQPMRDGVVYEIAPPYTQVNVQEQYFVIPASKGYFVLSYCAPEQRVEEHRGTFDQVVASFQPQLP